VAVLRLAVEAVPRRRHFHSTRRRRRRRQRQRRQVGVKLSRVRRVHGQQELAVVSHERRALACFAKWVSSVCVSVSFVAVPPRSGVRHQPVMAPNPPVRYGDVATSTAGACTSPSLPTPRDDLAAATIAAAVGKCVACAVWAAGESARRASDGAKQRAPQPAPGSTVITPPPVAHERDSSNAGGGTDVSAPPKLSATRLGSGRGPAGRWRRQRLTSNVRRLHSALISLISGLISASISTARA
jgi:hypothetical protein